MYAYTDSNDTLDKWAWLMKQTKLQLFLSIKVGYGIIKAATKR